MTASGFKINAFQPSVLFHMKTSHLICIANQVTGIYMEFNTGLILVNLCINKQ